LLFCGLSRIQVKTFSYQEKVIVLLVDLKHKIKLYSSEFPFRGSELLKRSFFFELLILYLSWFLGSEDEQFEEEKEFIIKEIEIILV